MVIESFWIEEEMGVESLLRALPYLPVAMNNIAML